MSTPWSQWVRQQMDRRRWEQADAARAAGLPRSAISQWLSTDARPTVENLRKFAAAVDTPILHALVLAGYITAEEAELGEEPVPVAEHLSNAELIRELTQRLGEDRGPAGRKFPDLPDTEVTWYTADAPSARRVAKSGESQEPRRSSG